MSNQSEQKANIPDYSYTDSAHIPVNERVGLFNHEEEKFGFGISKVSVYNINRYEDLPQGEAQRYSRIKYGDPEAVHEGAAEIVKSLLESKELQQGIAAGQRIVITSSAYGNVPTASDSLAKDVVAILKTDDVNVETIKINRGGDFETTHYGKMSKEERIESMKTRHLSITDAERQLLKDATLIVIDDLFATGMHQRATTELLQSTQIKDVIFSYLINFSPQLALEPHVEEQLNRAYIQTVADLRDFFKEPEDPSLHLRMNARTVKFILSLDPEFEGDLSRDVKKENLRSFLGGLETSVLSKIYQAASTRDNIHKNGKFLEAYQVLEEFALNNGIVSIEEINARECRLALSNIVLNAEGELVDVVSGENMRELIEKYSLMKFGSAEEIGSFAKLSADAFIKDIEDPNGIYHSLFLGAKEKDENIVMIGPGTRNVPVGSTLVFEKAVERINVFLALNDLPTVTFVRLPRLKSLPANYAELTTKERLAEADTTILPGVNLYKNKVHVIFADDVRISGSTADRIELASLDQGALSFHSLYLLQVDPRTAVHNPAVEDYLNKMVVKGELDQTIVDILNQEDFKPVQRLMRVVLGENNRDALYSFLGSNVLDSALKKLYIAALGNNYLSNSKYSESTVVLRQIMHEKGLVDENGYLL